MTKEQIRKRNHRDHMNIAVLNGKYKVLEFLVAQGERTPGMAALRAQLDLESAAMVRQTEETFRLMLEV